MPKPNDGETRDDFMKRCVPMVTEEGTAEDNSQAVAMFNSMYDKKSLTCNECEGSGRIKTVINNSQGGSSNHYKDCTSCNGTGEL